MTTIGTQSNEEHLQNISKATPSCVIFMFPPPRREKGLGRGLCLLSRKFFVTYSRKGAFWWIPDAFWRTNSEVVVCCAHDAANIIYRLADNSHLLTMQYTVSITFLTPM